LIVDAEDEAAQSFYAHYGFKAFAGVPLSMYLPVRVGEWNHQIVNVPSLRYYLFG
jgi:hypothetical protein